MIGYKGFDKDFKCRDMQYEVGKTYIEKEAKLCKKGLHFCKNPLDVFAYYSPADGKFAEIEADDVSSETGNDSKRVARKLTVKTEINLFALVKLGVEYIKTQIDWDNNQATIQWQQTQATVQRQQTQATIQRQPWMARRALQFLLAQAGMQKALLDVGLSLQNGIPNPNTG